MYKRRAATAIASMFLGATLAAPEARAQGGAEFMYGISGVLGFSVGSSLAVVSGQPQLIPTLFGVFLGGAAIVSIIENDWQSVRLSRKNGNKVEEVDVPVSPERARKLGLRPGDKVMVERKRGGVLITKDGKPVTFVLDQKSAEAFRSAPHVQFGRAVP